MYSGALGVLQKELHREVDMDVVEDMVAEMGCSTEVQILWDSAVM